MIGTLLRIAMRFLIGPGGRTLFIVGVVIAAWIWWAWTPLEPLASWSSPATDGMWNPTWPRISRDGSTLVEISNQPQRLNANPGENGSMAGPVRLWDLPAGRQRVSIPGPGVTELRAKLGPEGSWVLISTQRAGLTLWDGVTGRQRAVLRPPDEPDYMKFILPNPDLASDDGKLVAAVVRLNPHAIRVWESATGRLVAELAGARPPFAFSPDGRRLLAATTGENGRPGTVAKMWDIATGRELFSLSGHRWPLGSVAFSPDGRLLATGLDMFYHPPDSGDVFDVKIWEAHTGRLVTTLSVNGGHSLAFSPDSRLIVIWSPLGRGLVWDITQNPPGNRDDLMTITEMVVKGTPGLSSYYGPYYAPGGHAWCVTDHDGMTIAAAGEPTESPRPLVLPYIFGVLSHIQVGIYPHTPVFSDGGRVLAVPVRADVPNYRPGLNGLLDRVLHRPIPSKSWSSVRLYDPATGRTLGTLPTFPGECYVLGFTPDEKTFWTKRLIKAAGPPPSVLTNLFEQWSVPSPWPPAWLLATTSLAIALLIFDWRRGRRIARQTP